MRIPTDQILIEIAQGFGWRYETTYRRRIPNKRMPLRNSPSNRPGELGETMTEEHIVILQKCMTHEELGITRGLTVYLMATAPEDEAQRDITQEKIDNLNTQNVYLVVRDVIKQQRFSQSPTARGFTEFFCVDLPRLRANWRDSASEL